MFKRYVSVFILCALVALAACQPVTVSTPAPQGTTPQTAATAQASPQAPAPSSTAQAAATEQPSPQASAQSSTPAGAATELILVSHDSFAVSEDVLHDFETANNAKVQILKSGDAGAALNKAILAGASNPPGDLFFGVDNTFLSRALNQDLFAAYQPNGAAAIADAYKLDPQSRMTPIDFGDVCLNYDKAWFKTKNIPPPPNAGRFGKTRIQEFARRRKSGDLLAGACLFIGDGQHVRRWQVSRLLETAARE